MSKHLGDFDASAVVYGKFSTFRPSTGAAYTLGGTPALSVYKDNSLTQSTTGVTLTVDFDSVTGLNHYAIDTSADATFYAAGSFFDVVITMGTVDGVSVVGAVVGSFTIRKTSPLKPATAGRTLVVDSAGLADANAVKLGPSGSGSTLTARDIGASVLLSSGAGTGQLDFTNGVVKANLAQILATALTETAGQLAGGFKKFFNIASPASTMDVVARVTLTDTVTTYTGNTPQTGDGYARIGAGGAGLTAIGDTRIAHLDADITSRTKPADTQAAVTLVATTTAVTNDVGITQAGADKAWLTTNRTLTSFGTLVADTAAAVWAVLVSSITTTNSIGKRIVDYLTGDVYARLGAPAGASHAADIAQVETNIENIQSRMPNALVGGKMDSNVSTIASNAITAASIADDAVAEIQSGLSILTEGGVRSAVGLASANLDTQLGDLPTAVEIRAEIETNSTKLNTASTGVTTLQTRIPGIVQPQTGDSYARLGAPSGASVSADILSIGNAVGSIISFLASVVGDTAIAVWDALLSGISAAGSIGKLIKDNLNATIDSRLASGDYTAPDNTGITDIQSRLPAALVSGRMAADAVAISGSTTAADAVEANIGNLNAAVGSRLPTTSYVVPPTVIAIRTEVDDNSAKLAAIKNRTDLIPDDPAAVSDIPTKTEIAVEIFTLDLATVTGEAAKSFLNVCRLSGINKMEIDNAGVLHIYNESGTEAFVRNLTSNPDVEPIVKIEP